MNDEHPDAIKVLLTGALTANIDVVSEIALEITHTYIGTDIAVLSFPWAWTSVLLCSENLSEMPHTSMPSLFFLSINDLQKVIVR